MQAEATMREGTIEIPPAIRDILHLREGDTLVFEADDSGVRLRVLKQAVRASFREVAGIFGNDSEEKSIEQIVSEEREQRGY